MQPEKLTEKEQAAKSKAIWLVGEVKALPLPSGSFKMNGCTIHHNAAVFVDIQEAILLTALPLTHNWKAAYYRMWELKQYLQNLKKMV